MGVLIDEAQVRMLEDMMASQGFLSGQQMAGSFQFLHSRELVWSNRSKRWLLGEEDKPNDLMTWNTDVTRLPAVMHSQYLRQCFLNNDLANGHFKLDGQTLLLRNIGIPTYVVGTVKDHVSPWRSVYKIHQLVSGPVTFVLTNGGHNAGIISEPGHHGRHFQALTTNPNQPRLTADDWVLEADQHEGSWWTHWSSWLIEHGSKRQVAARQPVHSAKLGVAPGQYVNVCYAD
jgi:polyhydroxyalkanoate synthase